MHQMSLSEIEMVRRNLVYTLCLSQWNGNYEGFIDEHGIPVFTTPNANVFCPRR